MKKIKLFSLLLLLLALSVSLFACKDNNDPADDPKDDITYDITSFKIAGQDIGDYVIVANKNITTVTNAANKLKEAILEKTGVELTVSATAVEGKRSISIKEVEKACRSGFWVKETNADLFIECAYKDLTLPALEEFISSVIAPASDTFELESGYIYEAPLKTVKYSEFGAKGDGVTDDYLAIRDAHAHANKFGYVVEADEGATYLLGAKGFPSITIKTDTDWKGASFIIDDRAINTKALASSFGKAIFEITPSLKALTITPNDVKSVAKDAKSLGFAPGVDCLVYIQYDGVRRYVREGTNQNSGDYQQEIILVKADGTIDSTTPVIWDYPEINKIWAVPIDETPITIQNGNFKTLANTIDPTEYISVNRGLYITRSNTTMKNINHTVEQVEDYRAAYAGFFNVRKSNNVLIYNCEIQSHINSYFTSANGALALLGSYELSAGHACNVYYDKVIQTNFFEEENVTVHNAGLMGTNYCRNMYVTNSRFARFDAHCQVYNVTIKNSDLQRINAIGFGTVKIENTNFWGDYLVELRKDYGGLFNGDFYLKNVNVKYNGDESRISLFSTYWVNHDYGYKVVYPQNVYIDNLKVEKNGILYLFASQLDNKPNLTVDTVNGQKNLNPIVPTKLVDVKNNPAGTVFKINPGPTFANTELKVPEVPGGGSSGGSSGDNEGGSGDGTGSEAIPSNVYYINAGFEDKFTLTKDGFIKYSSAKSGGVGSINIIISGNGHNTSNIKLANNNGNQALLFSGVGNPNGVTNATNICVDLYPAPSGEKVDIDTYKLYKGKSFVVSFDIKPLEKTTDAHDSTKSELFTFNNTYTDEPGFVQNGIVFMKLSDYSLHVKASGSRPEIDLGKSLEIGKFSTVAMHVKVLENKFDLYVNGEKIADALPFANETEVNKICSYSETEGLFISSDKANKMEDFFISYARLARVHGPAIEAPIYELDNAKLYFSETFLGTGDLNAQ